MASRSWRLLHLPEVPVLLEEGEVPSMAKYIYAYHGGGMAATEEEQAAVMEAWNFWYGKLGAAIADGGAPTMPGKTIAPDGTVSDGGGANPLTGYTVIEADSLDDAIAKAADSPHLAGGGSIEISELIDMATG